MLDLIFKNLRKTPCVFLQVVEKHAKEEAGEKLY
jgi:hypothetical protein